MVSGCDYGPLLGVDESSEYTVNRLSLRHGDLITLTTDGITESRRQVNDPSLSAAQQVTFFGMDGLVSVLRSEQNHGRSSLREIQQRIVKSALDWSNGSQRDDICLLMARYL